MYPVIEKIIVPIALPEGISTDIADLTEDQAQVIQQDWYEGVAYYADMSGSVQVTPDLQAQLLGPIDEKVAALLAERKKIDYDKVRKSLSGRNGKNK